MRMDIFNKKPAGLPAELVESVRCYIAAYYERPRAIPKATIQKVSSFRRRIEEPCEAMEVCCQCESLEEMLKRADAGFSERLLQLIDQQGRKDAEVYKKAGVSKQHFSKIRNQPDYRPTKPTAVAFAIALGLNIDEANELLGRAGFTLGNSSKFDLIIRYCIENGIYDIVQINLVLYEFDQPLLCG